MLLDVLTSAGHESAVWLSMGRDFVPAARLTNPSKTGPKPPRTPTPQCVRAHPGTALQGPPIGR
ncbi:MAG TPA: hypothetical protein VGJ28_21235 [Micromonosporaceae bacterium]|jgi:hypothetical protein